MRSESEKLQDVVLMRRVATGDQLAFAALFDGCGSIVLGFLVRLLRSRAEGEEVLQEVFLQVWQRAGEYRPEVLAPCSWILMLARHRAIDRLRTQMSRSRREIAYGSGASAASPIGTARLEAIEQQRHLLGALDNLPPERRTYLELSFVQGLSHSEIAERLKAPLGTVKSRIRAALFELKRHLAAQPA